MEALVKLQTLSEELDEHAQRLGARATEIKARAAAVQDPVRAVQELYSLVGESMQEQVDTGLDFMREALVTVGEAVANLPAEGGGGDDAEVGLEQKDADQILEVLQEHLAMLEEYVPQVPPTEAQALAVLRAKIEKTKAVIDLVNGLVLEDTDEDEDDEDEDEDEDDAPASKNI
jgi:hypothetical protein